jgi:Fic family protein
MYIYRKISGDKILYYLRISKREGNKVISRDIANLGTDPEKIKTLLLKLDKKYNKELKKSWRNLDKTIEHERYKSKICKKKIKLINEISKKQLIEIESSKEHFNHIKKKIDEKTYNEIIEIFINDYSWNTASIEGNTIPLKEAEDFFNENLTPKASLDEIYDLRNNKEALKYVFNNFEDFDLSHTNINSLHKILMKDIDKRIGYRKFDVRVVNSRFESSPNIFIKSDMDELLRWYANNEKVLHPFILALVFHHKFEKIHPFADGNGRTGRLLINIILLKNNYPPIMIRRKNRTEYRESLGDADKGNYDRLFDYGVFEYENNYWNYFA